MVKMARVRISRGGEYLTVSLRDVLASTDHDRALWKDHLPSQTLLPHWDSLPAKTLTGADARARQRGDFCVRRAQDSYDRRRCIVRRWDVALQGHLTRPQCARVVGQCSKHAGRSRVRGSR